MSFSFYNGPPSPNFPPSSGPSKDLSSEQRVAFGSDAIAQQLSKLQLDFIALVPGSSYRGLHDSLVNFQGNSNPRMLICLHEEHAVSIAHGYAKVMGRPMAAAVHANVGLMHATMAIYNAFTDRIPVVLLGATGPLDASRRRPWIDWIHTAQDQGALIRPFVKWDDQPSSVNAALVSITHATVAARSKPCAPTYVCLDLSMQADSVDPKTVKFPDMERYWYSMGRPSPSNDDVLKILDALQESEQPVFLFGRMSTSPTSWEERIKLAEKFDARVITDIKQVASFPTAHRLHPTAPGVFITSDTSTIIANADLIISFDWVDLAGTLKAAGTPEPESAVIHVSLDSALHNGWSKDHFGLPPTDVLVRADVDKTLAALLTASAPIYDNPSTWSDVVLSEQLDTAAQETPGNDIYMPDLAAALYDAISPEDMCLVRVPLGWRGQDLRIVHPLSFMGMDGGAGVGSGPGQLVGTSLALQSTGPNLAVVAVLGDGDFLMGNSALWTACKYRLPLLAVVANNGSYFNDEVHQERVAKHRGRPVENKWVGMRLDDPQPDIHLIARGWGCTVVRPQQVRQKGELLSALNDAARELRAGGSVVLDVRVLPEGYASAMSEK